MMFSESGSGWAALYGRIKVGECREKNALWARCQALVFHGSQPWRRTRVDWEAEARRLDWGVWVGWGCSTPEGATSMETQLA